MGVAVFSSLSPGGRGLLSLRAPSCLVGIIAVSRASLRPYYRSISSSKSRCKVIPAEAGIQNIAPKWITGVNFVSRSGSGMTSMRGIVLLRDGDETLPMESKSLSKNLNLTALPLAGEGWGEGGNRWRFRPVTCTLNIYHAPAWERRHTHSESSYPLSSGPSVLSRFAGKRTGDEAMLESSCPLPTFGTRSVPGDVPTQSMGTSAFSKKVVNLECGSSRRLSRDLCFTHGAPPGIERRGLGRAENFCNVVP